MSIRSLATRLAAVLALAPACSGTVTEADHPPGGVGDKSVVETPRGLAVADELVVTFAIDAGEAAAGELLADLGGTVVWRGPRTGAYLVSFGDADTAIRALAELALRPEV